MAKCKALAESAVQRLTASDGALQLFQQELSSRQVVVDAIRSSVDSTDSGVSDQIETLNSSWQNVNRLSELRDSRLHEALVLVITFTRPIMCRVGR